MCRATTSKQTEGFRGRGSLLVTLVAVASACSGCKREESHVDKLIASAKVSAEPAPVPRVPFVFPAASGLPPRELIPTVNRAVRESPPGQEDRIDEWLKGVSIPVEPVAPTTKFASDVGALACRYREKALQCAIPAKLLEASKFFVTSSLTCIDGSGAVKHKTDWAAPSQSKRGERTELPVAEAFLTTCLAEGGIKLGVELLASPCAIPFPHQVRCAGEYNTCRDVCKASPSCDDRCETNRLHCLDVCKK